MQSDARTFTKGIWKSVYVVSVSSAAITHVVPHVFYNGSYPVGPLQPGQHGDFEVQVRACFRAFLPFLPFLPFFVLGG